MCSFHRGLSIFFPGLNVGSKRSLANMLSKPPALLNVMEIENYTCFPQAPKGALCNELVMQQHLECGVTASPGPPTEAHGSHKRR